MYRLQWHPSLRAAGADLDRVFSFDAVKVGEESEPPVLPCDLQALEKLIMDRQSPRSSLIR
jgi:hypothetical protein